MIIGAKFTQENSSPFLNLTATWFCARRHRCFMFKYNGKGEVHTVQQAQARQDARGAQRLPAVHQGGLRVSAGDAQGWVLYCPVFLGASSEEVGP